jgi:hypothetical protein
MRCSCSSWPASFITSFAAFHSRCFASSTVSSTGLPPVWKNSLPPAVICWNIAPFSLAASAAIASSRLDHAAGLVVAPD